MQFCITRSFAWCEKITCILSVLYVFTQATFFWTMCQFLKIVCPWTTHKQKVDLNLMNVLFTRNTQGNCLTSLHVIIYYYFTQLLSSSKSLIVVMNKDFQSWWVSHTDYINFYPSNIQTLPDVTGGSKAGNLYSGSIIWMQLHWISIWCQNSFVWRKCIAKQL